MAFGGEARKQLGYRWFNSSNGLVSHPLDRIPRIKAQGAWGLPIQRTTLNMSKAQAAKDKGYANPLFNLARLGNRMGRVSQRHALGIEAADRRPL